MVKHIVLFKLKDFDNDGDKFTIMSEIKKSLESLKVVIPVIRNIEIQFNVNPAEEFDLILYSEFDNLHDLEIYAKHPEHIKASKLLVENRVKRACVDYEF